MAPRHDKIRSGRHFSSSSLVRGSDGNNFWIYGLHSVSAALANPDREIFRLLVSRNRYMSLSSLLSENKTIDIEICDSGKISDFLGKDCVHQGIAAYISPLPSYTISDIAPGGIVVALDRVEDPHNVGSVMRSCAAYGSCGLIVCRRRGAPFSARMMKVASGGFEHVPYILVGNFARALKDLSLRNFLIIGLSDIGPYCLEEEMGKGIGDRGIVLVLGNEGVGLRRNTSTHCDMIARLPVCAHFSSLNVSSAASVALHIVSRRVISDDAD